MRSTRRRRFVGQLDNVMEILYRVYVGAFFGAVALAVLAGIVHDAGVGAEAADEIADKGPALLGAVVALAALAGLRSGARGGPLAIEDAEVQYVLLAPVDRGMALRPAGPAQMRVGRSRARCWARSRATSHSGACRAPPPSGLPAWRSSAR